MKMRLLDLKVIDVANKFVGLRNKCHVNVCELFNEDCIITIRLQMNRERREELGIHESEECTKKHFQERFKVEGYKKDE